MTENVSKLWDNETRNYFQYGIFQTIVCLHCNYFNCAIAITYLPVSIFISSCFHPAPCLNSLPTDNWYQFAALIIKRSRIKKNVLRDNFALLPFRKLHVVDGTRWITWWMRSSSLIFMLQPSISDQNRFSFVSGRSEPKGVGDPCAGCNKPILDKFLLNVLERGWHASCVRCCECLTPLTEKCFSREAKLYCRNDFFR